MSIVPTRARRMAAAAASLVVAGAALSGCATSPNDVAVVDGTSISRDQYEQAVAAAAQLSNGGQQATDDQVISVLIQGQVAADIAEQRSITITDGERDAKIGQQLLAVTQARPLLYDLADINIIVGQVGEDQFTKDLQSAKVTLNPRYGRWDSSKSVSVINDNGSLSQVLQQPTQ